MIPIVWMLTRVPLQAIPEPVWLLLICGMAVGLCSTIPVQLHLDTRKAWADEAATWHSPGLTDLPQRTPVDPQDAVQVDAPPTEVVERMLAGLRRWDAPPVVELRVGAGRHRIGEAPGTETQQARWNSPTGQFWLIVEALGDLDEPCSRCSAPERPQLAHVGCPGCSCPCGVVEPLPAGVAGYPIAGGTR